MPDAILVLNTGSSSLKFSIFGVEECTGEPLARGQVEGIGAAPRFRLRRASGEVIEAQSLEGGESLNHEKALRYAIDRCRRWLGNYKIVGAGHRVVHGGMKFAEPVAITPEVLADLERLVPLAPLHQPHSLAAIRAAIETMPLLPQVACFDTAFHRTQPGVAQQFGLPRRLTDEGVRRYGFHGLSYEYIASKLPNIDPRAATGRTIVAHLGNGASICALLAGKSIATTMSFTPLDGLVMGTRVGSLDPAVLLYLMARHGMNAGTLENLLYHESGLLGVSGVSSDMRELLASDDPRAAEAIDLFVYRINRELGSLTAALGGLVALVFTGGIGENAAAIRRRICLDAKWLGVSLDEAANSRGDARISHSDSNTAVWVIPTNEELMIANHTKRVLSLTGADE